MFARLSLAIAALVLASPLQPETPFEVPGERSWPKLCENWDDWDKSGPPYQIFGNTYYVGTCGIASILIVTDEGLVLIDTGTRMGAEVVRRNIQLLGYDPKDIRVILNSHEHFDHVGGLAKVQEWSNATVMTSRAAVPVLASGRSSEDDPQHGMHEPMAPVKNPLGIEEDAVIKVGLQEFHAIATPGHTPGALSWWWDSCHGATCARIVYADSLSPVSRDDYAFSDHSEYVADYRKGLEELGRVDCDILITPHPSSSMMHARLSERGGLLGSGDCQAYAKMIEGRLDERLAKEAAQ